MQGKIKYLILNMSNGSKYSSFLLKVNDTEKQPELLMINRVLYSFNLRLHFQY